MRSEGDELGFVLGLPMAVADADRARAVSWQFLRLMRGAFPEFVVASATLAQEGLENVRHDMFCARWLATDERCMRRPRHDGNHSPAWSL